ncbi:hypothetical protein M3Y99_01620400 [Aphelenchoides fujianensis]|nr:hypothetical protein M3Y99_01620400 [Aphelenchoides fujianensis]
MAMLTSSRQILVETSDKEHFQIPVGLVRSASVLEMLFGDELEREERGDYFSYRTPEPCVLPEISARLFERILTWLAGEHDCSVSNGDLSTPEFSDFEQEFLDLPESSLRELLKAAEYLGHPIVGLLRNEEAGSKTGRPLNVTSSFAYQLLTSFSNYNIMNAHKLPPYFVT